MKVTAPRQAGDGSREAVQAIETPAPGNRSTTRRQLLKKAGVALAVVAAAELLEASEALSVVHAETQPGGSTAGAKPVGAVAPLSSPSPDWRNNLLRMQDELAAALNKPLAERRWGMVIDRRKCVGCMSCTVACKAENGLPPGVVYRPVIEKEVGTYPVVARRFTPRPCMQCENPPCVPVCPVHATYRRPDGVVAIDYQQCIGCRYCISACPYGARQFDFGEYYTAHTPELEPYELSPSHEYGKKWVRKGGRSPVGNARKCQFCLHRLNAGMLPACVTTCIGGATYFGDLKLAGSLVSEMIGKENTSRLKEELGTHPAVYYLG